MYFENSNLSGYNLTGSIPPELAGLTEVQNLDLSSNRLRGTIPSTLSSLTQLENLFAPLQSRYYNYLPPFYFRNLSNNQLFGCPPVIESSRPTFTQSFDQNLLYCTCPNIGTTICICMYIPGNLTLTLTSTYHSPASIA